MNGGAILVCFLGLSALAVVLVSLYLRHRNLEMLHVERMAAIDKSVDVPVGRLLAPWSPRAYLLRGLIWTMSGAALAVFLLGIAASSKRQASEESLLYNARNLSDQARIPLDDARKIVEKDRDSRETGLPMAVALLGLIPFAIGLAYLAYYFTDDTRHAPGNSPPSHVPVLQG